MSRRTRRQARQRRQIEIRANAQAGKVLRLSAADQSVTLQAADGENALPRVTMLAYSGGPMMVGLFASPVVVDLDGLKITAKQRPLLADHNPGRVVGHTERIYVKDGQLFAEGVLSGANDTTREIVQSAKNGMPWQASIGAPVERYEFVKAGSSVRVNGRQFAGPLVVVRASRLSEISVVALGADDNTTTTIAARRQGVDMDFNAWLRANGFDPEQISAQQKGVLEAAWKAEEQHAGGNGGDVDHRDGDQIVATIRAKAQAEADRIAKIEDLTESHKTIRAKAIAEGWTPTKTELEVLKAGYASVNGIVRPGTDEPQQLNSQTLEAAVMGSLGRSDDERLKWYGEKTLEAADKFRGIGFQELALLCARKENKDVPPIFGDGQAVLQAAFSTVSLPGITENVLSKIALMTYRAAEIQILQIARRRSVRDFKKVTSVRMLGSGRFEKVSKAGELESGIVGEQKYENQADTYGQVLFLDRKTIKNDDLGVLNDAGIEIGATGAEALNHVGFEVLLGAGSFFAAGNGNLLTGASASALGETGLTGANTLFRKQKAGPGSKSKDQRPININAEILLVPPELEVTAQILTGSANIDAGGGSARGDFNPWRGRYRVVSAPHLSDSSYTGYSTTAWYLMANPQRLPTLEAVFLDGRETPQIERVAPPANQLGVGFRAFIDFGIALQDPKGAVKATGVDP